MGLVRESLSVAWLECYREFAAAGRAPDPATEEAIRCACQIPYEARQELLPGAAETLGRLHQLGLEITIWTAGDEAVRRAWPPGSNSQSEKIICRTCTTSVRVLFLHARPPEWKD